MERSLILVSRRQMLAGLGAVVATFAGLGAAGAAAPVKAFLGSYRYVGGDKQRKARDKAIDASVAELSSLIRGMARDQLIAANSIAASLGFASDKKNLTVAADARKYTAPLDGTSARVKVPTGDEMDLRYAIEKGRLDQLFKGEDRGRTNRFTFDDDDNLVMNVRVFASMLPKDVVYKLTYERE